MSKDFYDDDDYDFLSTAQAFLGDAWWCEEDLRGGAEGVVYCTAIGEGVKSEDPSEVFPSDPLEAVVPYGAVAECTGLVRPLVLRDALESVDVYRADNGLVVRDARVDEPVYCVVREVGENGEAMKVLLVNSDLVEEEDVAKAGLHGKVWRDGEGNFIAGELDGDLVFSENEFKNLY